MDKELSDLLGHYINTVGDVIDYIYANRDALGEHADALMNIIGKIWPKEEGK